MDCKSEGLLTQRNLCRAWNKPCHCGVRGHVPKVCKKPEKWPAGATIFSKVGGAKANNEAKEGPTFNDVEQQREEDRNALDVAAVAADLNSVKADVLSALQTLTNKVDEK